MTDLKQNTCMTLEGFGELKHMTEVNSRVMVPSQLESRVKTEIFRALWVELVEPTHSLKTSNAMTGDQWVHSMHRPAPIRWYTV